MSCSSNSESAINGFQMILASSADKWSSLRRLESSGGLLYGKLGNYPTTTAATDFLRWVPPCFFFFPQFYVGFIIGF